MNYDSSTGEFAPQININFKIPLKCNVQNESHETIENSNEIDDKTLELFSSPLAAQDAYTNMGAASGYETGNSSQSPKVTAKRKNNDTEDETPKERLPVKLTKLLQPLACQLCKVEMNSPISAKLHYESKQHVKKINNWLMEWTKETGIPMPKRERKNDDGPVGPNALHCAICDLALTSLQHAQQHYTGKKHRSVLAGRGDPNGSGYYGEDGKWIRTNTKVAPDLSGRFNIGEAFVVAEDKVEPSVDPEKFCNICNISVTSVPQMKVHLEGTKHAKKLRALGAPPHASKNDTILCSINKTVRNTAYNRDNSIHRTPSGCYYCKPCDITIATEVLFNQHLDSKKHLKKSSNEMDSEKRK